MSIGARWRVAALTVAAGAATVGGVMIGTGAGVSSAYPICIGNLHACHHPAPTSTDVTTTVDDSTTTESTTSSTTTSATSTTAAASSTSSSRRPRPTHEPTTESEQSSTRSQPSRTPTSGVVDGPPAAVPPAAGLPAAVPPVGGAGGVPPGAGLDVPDVEDEGTAAASSSTAPSTEPAGPASTSAASPSSSASGPGASGPGANGPDPDTELTASSGLLDARAVAGGVVGLMLAGAGAGVISARGARAQQVRLDRARGEIFS
ncbi:MAG: hypothetical protein WBC54_14330 [Rhodococcus sp. (in: high G+C Gram-positive bacteria)]|uniref:hypothetical protein n=1 Tax=Rhodococcus sp. SBT000017 TaxID=1803385 RepID=UPI0011C3E969|nr:hypothetical protein [Rhodococcus sp. SBT000017]